ncbi:MAG: CBS domain-containing protein [bacterium]|nr:CBS domain-containing protein [Deltaproteobacteria bacterium]MCP4905486.1 CBS domain-containing protein [bacterium]
MKKNEPIEKILTRGVETVHAGMAVSDVRKLFADRGFHHVPVVSGKKLVGLIAASDILGISVDGVGADDRSMDAYLDHRFTIEELMTEELRTLPLKKSTIADAAKLLSEGSFHAVPVVDETGQLEGLVTSTDLIRYLLTLF